MINTIAHTELHRLWDGKVIVDEIKQFKDDRGLLTELWRVDDAKINDSLASAIIPQMSYWSMTNSFVMRGPHEHKDQCDWFVSWFSRMVYQLYNPKTNQMFHFITDPSKVYRIKVDIGIIHSYRNLELRPVTTGNFPSALFMGEDKKKPIDEVRHENLIGEDLKTYVILGAGGRLGKALTKYLFDNMGYHKYHVIPYFDKLNCESDVEKFFVELMKSKPPVCQQNNTFIINCAALTNVQKLLNYTNEVKWANVDLPESLAKHAHRNECKFYQMSTDYVFRENDKSVYTVSKQDMEKKLQDTDAYIIRVANLFSLDTTDTHNIVSKLKEKAKANESIQSDPSQYIFPTEVSALVPEIIKFINDEDSSKEIGFFGPSMRVEDLYKECGGTHVTNIKSQIMFNVNKFLDSSFEIDCMKEVLQKIKE